jgi:hypothetical protein
LEIKNIKVGKEDEKENNKHIDGDGVFVRAKQYGFS